MNNKQIYWLMVAVLLLASITVYGFVTDEDAVIIEQEGGFALHDDSA